MCSKGETRKIKSHDTHSLDRMLSVCVPLCVSPLILAVVFLFYKMTLIFVRASAANHTSVFGGFWTVSIFSFIMAGCLFVILMCSLHLIQVQGQKPQLSLQHYHGDLVLFTCSLPGSANSVTSCNLYFGERSRPILTTTVWKKKTSAKRWFCQFSVKIDDFLRHLHFVQQKDASCDYNLGSERNSLSPRSDGYNLIDIVEKESPTKPAFTMTTALTVARPKITEGRFISTSPTSVKPPSGMRIWKRVVTGFGVTVGIISLGLALLCTKSGSGKDSREPQNEDSDLYHVYANISEEPAASAQRETVDGTLQIH